MSWHLMPLYYFLGHFVANLSAFWGHRIRFFSATAVVTHWVALFVVHTSVMELLLHIFTSFAMR